MNGANQLFEFTPDEGYIISGVWIDGNSIGYMSSYEFTQVSGNHTIYVNFALNTLIHENDNENIQIAIYPNPAKNNITVEIKQINTEQISLCYMFIDLLGRQLSGGNLKTGLNDIKISELPAGMIYMGIYDKNVALKVVKVVVNK